MIQRGKDTRFTLEAGHSFVVRGEHLRQDLKRDTAAEPSVHGSIDLTHTSGTEFVLDFVMCEASSDHDRVPYTFTSILQQDN
jgi:hypothetical protein